MSLPAVRPCGDRAILVEFADELSTDANGRARALARRMRDVPGVLETVPALRSALLIIDPLRADRAAIAGTAADLATRLLPDTTGTGRVIDVPVVYGEEAGADLDDVAAALNLPASEVIALHTSGEFGVFMLGFAPGFPYMGLLPQPLEAPRLATPRLRVPAGSVAIAGVLTGIYPLQTPGGWALVGRTPLRIYDPREPDPILFRPGDRVRFTQVTSAQFPADRITAPPLLPSRPAFDVIEAGLFTTMQDLGRHGYRSLGMPGAGAMDPDALRLANLIAGNSPAAAALECTAPGPALRALSDLSVAVTGADLTATVDGTAIDMWRAVQVRAGQVIRFGAPHSGMWAYIAPAGGIEARTVLGSASTYFSGGVGRRLERGDIIGVGVRHGTPLATPLPAQMVRIPRDEVTVHVIPGPQGDWFPDDAVEAFFDSPFRVTVQHDRAGIRLDGPAISRDPREMLSDAMLPGAIQVPPDGRPIVIMVDGPTTGGYPKIGVVATVDLPLLAQARPGTRVRFMQTTVERAVEALRARETAVQDLQHKGRSE